MQVFPCGTSSWLVSPLVYGNAASQALLADPAPIVGIDPGPPSEANAGRVRLHGTTEVHIAWQVASKLRERLLQRGVRVCMTKTDETAFVTNGERAEQANRAQSAMEVFEG